MKRPLALLIIAVLCLSAVGCGKAPSTTATTTIATTTTTAAPTTTTTVTTTTTTAATKPSASPAPTRAPVVLDAAYSRLLLVNASHPLPADFDNTADLVDIPDKYRNGSLKQIDRGIYPYVIAMVDAARADGVKLYVRSPYRSYATQKMLFTNKVNKVIAAGTPKDQAEAKAAQAVARPGTSEHQTGLAIDFNTASTAFENSDAFKWMKANAENYGFILRYPAGKTDVTGIMYEAWHWRFVGINTAKEINRSGLTLEEYLAQKAAA